jgi:hypothetical protein
MGENENEGIRQTPENLLDLILGSDREKQLRLCQVAIEASTSARKCFLDGHTVEIDNLNRHIKALSIALVDMSAGRPVDPGLMIVAAKDAATAMGSESHA